MSAGRHLILDLYECDPEILDDYEKLHQLMIEALKVAGATILRVVGEKFEPQGVTLVALLAESHASIHTWPCEKYAAVDMYTCGEKTKTHAAAKVIKEGLKAELANEKELVRPLTHNKSSASVY